MVWGFRFFTKDGEIVLRAGYEYGVEPTFKKHTVHLEDGERVIGYKSRANPKWPNEAFHCDFQLIIGRLV